MSGVEVMKGPTYVLPAGEFNLTCVAYQYVNGTNPYLSTITARFPFGNMTTHSNNTIECSDNATISGFAVREYVRISYSAVIKRKMWSR